MREVISLSRSSVHACDICGNDPCTCQRQLEVVKRDWLVQTCSASGCSVIIRAAPGMQQQGPPICKWHQLGTAYYARERMAIIQDVGPCRSREEFGGNLFNAIFLNAQRLQAERDGQTHDAKSLQDLLQPVLETLATHEVRRILGMR